MKAFSQSPTDPGFVQDPYPFYEKLRAAGPLAYWEAYALPVSGDHATVSALLRDRRLGRETPPELAQPWPDHLAAFGGIETRSLLELDGPAHARLRRVALRGFTSRAIGGLEPGIAARCDALIDAFPAGEFDLIDAYCRPLPVAVIAGLIGLPQEMAPQLLAWSTAMVGMYMAGRDAGTEARAESASRDFTAYLAAEIAARRQSPREDFLSTLMADPSLTEAEIIATAVLLLNAGHEATVHGLGNGLSHVLAGGHALPQDPEAAERMAEEMLRHDPPLHLFTRWVYEPLEIAGQAFARGDRIGLLLAAAGRDPSLGPDPERFDPTRKPAPHVAFGAGPHFCLGAPLARLEMRIALQRLAARAPRLALAEPPRYADIYHFRGLEALRVRRA